MGAIVIMLWSGTLTLLAYFVLRYFNQHRVSLEDEEAGIDMATHNEVAYTFTTKNLADLDSVTVDMKSAGSRQTSFYCCETNRLYYFSSFLPKNFSYATKIVVNCFKFVVKAKFLSLSYPFFNNDKCS